jgi:phosphoribosylanthranilate isomerase
MLVQIYETQNPAEARELEAVGVDHVGVLVGKGAFPRELDYAKTGEIFAALTHALRVALTLSCDVAEISEVVDKTHPDILHLGTVPEGLSPSDVRGIKRRYPTVAVMRTIAVIDEGSLALANAYAGIADYLLLDTYQAGDTQVGATGETHNWEISRAIVDTAPMPVLLAGGLGLHNVVEAIRRVRPAGVDSKTLTDLAGGPHKDMEKVREFVRMAKAVP